MQYKLELIRRNRPNNRLELTLTIETDMEQYINSYQSVFDDYEINEFLAKLHEDFIMIASECLDICDVKEAQQSLYFARECHS